MTGLTSLWLPIVVSAAFVFVASSILHMAIPWHRSDYSSLPARDRARDAFRAWTLAPGAYLAPRPASREGMKAPEFQEKMKKGPVLVLSVLPGGTSFGSRLALWFAYSLVISLFAAYITGRAVGPGEPYLHVFRFAGATAFIGYSAGLWQFSIWFSPSWLTTFQSTVDGLIYGLLTAGTFGWLWPK